MKWRSEECSAGRSLPERVSVLLVPSTFTRPFMPRSAMASSMRPLYSAAAEVMEDSSFLTSGAGAEAAGGGAGFVSTALTGTGTGSDFAGSGEVVEAGGGTTAELSGCTVFAGTGVAAGWDSGAADFGVEGAGAGESDLGRLLSSRVA